MPEKTSPKDVFLHLLAIITLYISAGSFLTLIYQYANILFPDIAMPEYYPGNFGTIRWAIASLVVVFPVFLFTTRHLNKSYEASPTKRNLRTRKWLIYFTMFAAALLIIGDLVTLLNYFLSGELTIRFIIKVLAIFFVAGSVFYYYLWDLRKYKIE